MTIEWLWLGIGALLGAFALWFVMSRQLAAERGREEELEVALSKAKDEASDFRRKANEGKTTIKGLRDSAAAGDRAVAKLAEVEAAQAAARGELEDLLSLRDRTIVNLRAEVGEREETIDQLRAQLPKKSDGAEPKPVVREVVAVEASVSAAESEAAKAAAAAAAAESQAGKAAEKVTKLEADLASSRETNRVLNQRATELKAAINRLEQKFLTRNRRIRDLEQELEARDDVGALVAPAPPEEGPEPDVEKLANEKLVLAYKRDMESRDGRIAELRKQISQRDRKISQLLDADRAENAHATPNAADHKHKADVTAPKTEAVAEVVETAETAVEAVAEEVEESVEVAEAVAEESVENAEAVAEAAADEVEVVVEEAESVVEAAAGEPEAVDDLTRIKGVGPVFERRLNAAGVYRFDALAELSADRIRELVEAKDWQAAGIPEWIDQARELANGG